ncbi:MAG: hypothetical protein IJ088_10765, partial [Clostridia bacterium]|nr:hypothetical protein [Clostridia bacterium]
MYEKMHPKHFLHHHASHRASAMMPLSHNSLRPCEKSILNIRIILQAHLQTVNIICDIFLRQIPSV